MPPIADTNRRGRVVVVGEKRRATVPVLSRQRRQRVKRVEPRGGANRRAKTDKLARAIVAKEPTPRLPTRRRVAFARARSSAAAASTTSGGWYRTTFLLLFVDTRVHVVGTPGSVSGSSIRCSTCATVTYASRGASDFPLAPAPATHLSAPSTSFWRSAGSNSSIARRASATAPRVLSSSGNRRAFGNSAVAGVALPPLAASTSTAESNARHTSETAGSAASPKSSRSAGRLRDLAELVPRSLSHRRTRGILQLRAEHGAPSHAVHARGEVAHGGERGDEFRGRRRSVEHAREVPSASPAAPPCDARNAGTNPASAPPPPSSASSRSSATASNRASIAARPVSGCAIHRRSNRPPAAVTALEPINHRSEPRCARPPPIAKSRVGGARSA